MPLFFTHPLLLFGLLRIARKGFFYCLSKPWGLAKAWKNINKYKWLDIICGTHNYHKIPEYLWEYYQKHDKVREVYSIEGNVIENIPVKRDNKYTAWVNIQYGCDKFCTYCIVPYTRGKQRSRRPEDIIMEVRELYNNGYQEARALHLHKRYELSDRV